MFRKSLSKVAPILKTIDFSEFSSLKKQSSYSLIFLRLRLKVLIHHCFPKSRAWKLRLQLLKNRKACFTSPTWPIWALSLLILGYSKRARIQICRFDDYEWLMMSRHSARWLMPHPWDRQGGQIPRSSPRGWGLDWCLMPMRSNVVGGLLKPWTIAAHALFSIISQSSTAEWRALQWRENDVLHERAENFA